MTTNPMNRLTINIFILHHLFYCLIGHLPNLTIIPDISPKGCEGYNPAESQLSPPKSYPFAFAKSYDPVATLIPYCYFHSSILLKCQSVKNHFRKSFTICHITAPCR
jgi:hypothetical protein